MEPPLGHCSFVGTSLPRPAPQAGEAGVPAGDDVQEVVAWQVVVAHAGQARVLPSAPEGTGPHARRPIQPSPRPARSSILPGMDRSDRHPASPLPTWGRTRTPLPGEDPLPCLLDERDRPDFRDLFGSLCRSAAELDVAVARIRLGALDLGKEELGGLRRIRVVLAEVNAVRLGSEADASLADPGRAGNVRLLMRLFEEGRLELRAAPLAGWSPDFSVFGDAEGPQALLVGTHWFQRPYPHPGPALASLHRGEEAYHGARRFGELWASAYDIGPAIRGILEASLRRTEVQPPTS